MQTRSTPSSEYIKVRLALSTSLAVLGVSEYPKSTLFIPLIFYTRDEAIYANPAPAAAP